MLVSRYIKYIDYFPWHYESMCNVQNGHVENIDILEGEGFLNFIMKQCINLAILNE